MRTIKHKTDTEETYIYPNNVYGSGVFGQKIQSQVRLVIPNEWHDVLKESSFTLWNSAKQTRKDSTGAIDNTEAGTTEDRTPDRQLLILNA